VKTQASILERERWQSLHRAAYLSAILGVIHYWWQVKSDIRKPLESA